MQNIWTLHGLAFQRIFMSQTCLLNKFSWNRFECRFSLTTLSSKLSMISSFWQWFTRTPYSETGNRGLWSSTSFALQLLTFKHEWRPFVASVETVECGDLRQAQELGKRAGQSVWQCPTGTHMAVWHPLTCILLIISFAHHPSAEYSKKKWAPKSLMFYQILLKRKCVPWCHVSLPALPGVRPW